jgi:hypothetical protein
MFLVGAAGFEPTTCSTQNREWLFLPVSSYCLTLHKSNQIRYLSLLTFHPICYGFSHGADSVPT